MTQFFPTKEITVKSTDKKWLTVGIEQNSRRRKDVSRRKEDQGLAKDDKYIEQNITWSKLSNKKLAAVGAARSSRQLKTTDVKNPGEWKIQDMFPGKNKQRQYFQIS